MSISTTIFNGPRKRLRKILTLAAVMHLSIAGAGAEELVISDNAVVNTGHHIYMRECAVCHGQDARGAGPFAPMLITQPTDLTLLSQRGDGQFPAERVYEIISGNELLPAHGGRDMPIWGQEFMAEAENLGVDAKQLVRGRIMELIAYLTMSNVNQDLDVIAAKNGKNKAVY